MSSEFRPTIVGTAVCEGEASLVNSANNDSVFAVDLHLCRELVSLGLTDDGGGIERMEQGGVLSENHKDALKKCLGRISRGECPHYQKN